ncbi:glycosyltransferase [Cellulophaga baltica]|uniref:glycosyltransferase n=1 Tax=Cellulophaga baltica TaxID=76594 RepID=UPI00040C7332|nr:glycosyltransferase [Cellulophaga baltica]MBA6313762.1 glycosyltransferase family 4 protein [Cellulophaga baltica]MCR1023262.1 glycosyltransferase [Cellulophaga baltica]
MKVLLISPASSIHTIRWANSLTTEVDEIALASMHEPLEELNKNVRLFKLKHKAPFGYFTNRKALKKIIEQFKPDIINTHYLSGYGTLSGLSVNKHNTPYLLSMWGSDIFDFPEKSLFHKMLIEWVAKKSTRLASTSNAMKLEFIKKYPSIRIPIDITPFGVNTKLFSPKMNNRRKSNTTFEIGIAKVLEKKYGIKYLIEAFKLLQKEKQFSNSRLHIIGSGRKELELKKISEKNENIIFYGRINNSELPQHINKWHVSVIPSILDSESFGVSAVEVSSCGIPVIVSNVGGLPEVVKNNESGIVVRKENAREIYEKLKVLFLNEDLRIQMGKKGREHVLQNYDWDKNVKTMLEVYNKTISDFNSMT